MAPRMRLVVMVLSMATLYWSGPILAAQALQEAEECHLDVDACDDMHAKCNEECGPAPSGGMWYANDCEEEPGGGGASLVCIDVGPD